MPMIKCPHCGTTVGRRAAEGGVVMNGLSITLIKADGTVTAPCKRCRTQLTLVEGGKLEKSISDAMPQPTETGRRRVVFVVDDEPSGT